MPASAAALARDPLYRGYRFPGEIISHAVWLYVRFALSHRDVEEVLAARGVRVSYEAIRLWCQRFGPIFAGKLRRQRSRSADTWHLDEVQLKIKGRKHWLWRAVDRDGLVLDILVQARRNQESAVCNHFRPRRHLLPAEQYRQIRAERFQQWHEAAGVQPAA